MNQLTIQQMKRFRTEVTRFMMLYKFALDEMETKIDILQEEFQFLHEYNPIEHTKSRLKSPESILNKLQRKGCELSLPSIRAHIKDIAGLRITCSFLSDIYIIRELLQNQTDLRILEEKDYIRQPKANGYQSLHLLVEIPVFMSDREERVCIEVQIRTIAMDFWASLEHKIYYKYNHGVPAPLLQELKEAADAAAALDRQMERLHQEVDKVKEAQAKSSELNRIVIKNQEFVLPAAFFKLIDDSSSGSNG
ncbi:GTP pyrophosphokinase [Paenibacillus cremeus]|uniref:GTP pyrophosphokinase family protein n=1 Tax=Paenibacillus cremeus TaxID=2163881 RepID=A0A559KHC9_9BACL|nr:GTP pyrophosphokinase family protein [Paenibacillus cremeus]TVY11516.1 GTP pyrophosphokinase family protein [Paenibacillus cremeus]